MNLESIEQIFNGMCVFMPSGLEAEISQDDNGDICVRYSDQTTDTYTQDEFGNIIKDGVKILTPMSTALQSVLMENNKNSVIHKKLKSLGLTAKNNNTYTANSYGDTWKVKVNPNEIVITAFSSEGNKNYTFPITTEEEIKNVLNRLDMFKKDTSLHECKICDAQKLFRIALLHKDPEIRQTAVSLLDKLNLNVDVENDTKKFINSNNIKNEKYRRNINMNTRNITEELKHFLNELNDETTDNTFIGRVMDKEKGGLDGMLEQEKILHDKYEKARSYYEECSALDNPDEFDNAKQEMWAAFDAWMAVIQEIKNPKKLQNNIDLTLKREFRRNSMDKTNEDFDADMLTDVNDIDFPDALADTVETTEDGELLTLEKVVDEIQDTKSEILDAVEEIKDKVDNIESPTDVDNKEAVELPDNLENDIKDLENEIADDTEPESEENEENENTENPEMEESFKKYLRKGKYEDLNKTKQKIDNAVRNGESVDDIKTDIVLNSEDEKEEEAAKEYASQKLKETLLQTQYTSKIQF